MDPISNATASARATAGKATSAADGGFAAALQQTQQNLPVGMPPSAYVPKPGPYSVERCGSHIVNGVELVPGAPGYQQDLAVPWLEEIAASNAALAAFQAAPAKATPLAQALEPAAFVLARAAQADSAAASAAATDAASLPPGVEPNALGVEDVPDEAAAVTAESFFPTTNTPLAALTDATTIEMLLDEMASAAGSTVVR